MQTEDYPTPGIGPNGTNWRPTGIDPNSLGVRREDDPEGYLKAYRAAYAKLHKKPPAVFQTPEQKQEKYKQTLARANLQRAEKKLAAEQAMTDDQRAAKAAAELAKREMYAKRKHERQLAGQLRDRKENPEKYAERRIKKVKWAKWSQFKWFYAEARRLTGVTGKEWNVEHIYPVTSDWVCGLHTPDNLRVATLRENMRKGNRPFGPVGDELWDPDHYSVYWPGERKLLPEKRADAERPAKQAAVAARKLDAAREAALKKAQLAELPKKPRGRKGMTAEKAALMPAVQELLKGRAIREVSRIFGKNSLKIAQYAKLVDPNYQSPFHKHGRPQLKGEPRGKAATPSPVLERVHSPAPEMAYNDRLKRERN